MADLRRCIGSAKFGIEPHETSVEDFPAQPSQKDGLGRMCKTHWNQYTASLARDAKARKSAEARPVPETSGPVPETVTPTEVAAPAQPHTARKRARRAGDDGDPGQ